LKGSRPFLLKDTRSKAEIREWLGRGLEKYAARATLKWNDEDTLCESFVSAIAGSIVTTAGEFSIDSYKVRGRGPQADEKRMGADGIGLVSVRTQTTDLKGFFLFQAKKGDLREKLGDARAQCERMLGHSAASHLIVLGRDNVRVAGAMAVVATAATGPRLGTVPYCSFRHFVSDQLLRGLMVAPLEPPAGWFADGFASQVRYILAIRGTDDSYHDSEDMVENLGLNLAQLSDSGEAAE